MESTIKGKLAELETRINKANDADFDTILSEQVKQAISEEKGNDTRIIVDGLLTQRFTTRWGKKEGQDKVVERMKSLGRTRVDKAYLIQCALTAWYAQNGVDLFILGSEKRRRSIFKLVSMNKDGNVAFKKERYQEILESVLAGEHTHKNEKKEDVTTELHQLTGTLFTEVFKIKGKKQPLVNWSISKLEGQKEEKIVSAVKTWFADALKQGIDKDDDDYATYNNPVALKIAEAIMSMVTPIVEPESRSTVKDRANKRLQEQQV